MIATQVRPGDVLLGSDLVVIGTVHCAIIPGEIRGIDPEHSGIEVTVAHQAEYVATNTIDPETFERQGDGFETHRLLFDWHDDVRIEPRP